MKKPFPHTTDTQLEKFVEWCGDNEKRYPKLKLLIGIPNVGGSPRTYIPKEFLAQGFKRASPDLFLPTPIGECHGIFIQFKVQEGTARGDDILNFAKALRAAGYDYWYMRTWSEAAEMVKLYFR